MGDSVNQLFLIFKFAFQFLGWLTILYIADDFTFSEAAAFLLLIFFLTFSVAITLAILERRSPLNPRFVTSLALDSAFWLAHTVPLIMSLVGLNSLFTTFLWRTIELLQFDMISFHGVGIWIHFIFICALIYLKAFHHLLAASLIPSRHSDSELVRAAKKQLPRGTNLEIYSVESSLPWLNRPWHFSGARPQSSRMTLFIPSQLLAKFSEQEFSCYIRYLSIRSASEKSLKLWRHLGFTLIGIISLSAFTTLASGHVPLNLQFLTWLIWVGLTVLSILSVIRWTHRRRDDLTFAVISTWSASERNHLAMSWFHLIRWMPYTSWRIIEQQTLLANRERNLKLPLSLAHDLARIPSPVTTSLLVGLLSLWASWP